MSAVEIELRRLRHTSLPLEVTGATPLIEFWTEIAKFKSERSLLFPHFTQLASILHCLLISNATVERLFSVMGVVKSKLRNHLAIPTVEAILATRHGLRRRG